MSRLKMALLIWKCGIFFFALTAVIGGITRFAIFLGVAHNGTEMNMIVALAMLLNPTLFKKKVREGLPSKQHCSE